MDQLLLSPDPEPQTAATIQTRFEDFHDRNPLVYDALVSLARTARAKGKNRVGMGQLFEVLRWQWSIGGLPDDHEFFKLNNNYRSRYARLIMEREHDLEDVFATRGLTAL